MIQLTMSGVLDSVRGLVGGASVMFWAFATWLTPALAAALWWRHRVQRVLVAYDATLWSMVFPHGMCAVAGIYLGKAEGCHGSAPSAAPSGGRPSWRGSSRSSRWSSTSTERC